MRLTSSAFRQGEAIPKRFTCDGEDVSPQLSWQDAPKETKAFAVIVHDPDAPRAEGFTHWLLYNIPPNVTSIQENVPKQAKVSHLGVQGLNDFGKLGYGGPCPPSGSHRYFVRLYALRKELDLEPGTKAQQVQEAISGIVIEQTELMGTYARMKAKGA